MHIDASVFRKVQNRLRKNLPECRNDNQVGVCFLDHIYRIGISEPLGLKYRNAVLKRQQLDRRHRKLLASSLRAVRLRYRKNHLIRFLKKTLKNHCRDVGRPHIYHSDHLLLLGLHHFL